MDDVTTLIRTMVRQEWRLEVTKKKRKLHSPEGGFVSFSSTPSCPHAMNQIRRDIKRLNRENKDKHGNIHRHPALENIQDTQSKVPHKSYPRNAAGS